MNSITVNGQQVLIADLPREIREEFDLLEKCTEDMEEQRYQYTVRQYAVEHLKYSVAQRVKEHLEKEKDEEKDVTEESPHEE